MSRRASAPAATRIGRGRHAGPPRSLSLLGALALLATILSPGGALAATAAMDRAPTPAEAMPSDYVYLSVLDEAGDPIPYYRWRIDVDDTGDPRDTPENRALCFPATNPDYPEGCPWPSVHPFTGGAGGWDNLVTQGNQDEFSESVGLEAALFPEDPAHPGDPNYNKFLVSVIADDPLFDGPGHKIGGIHFALPLEEPGVIVVRLKTDPLPLGKIRINTYDDTSTNGQYDPGIEGPPIPEGTGEFEAHIADVLGEVTTDWFGNPLCARYDGAGEYIPGSGGRCIDDDGDGVDELTDHDGIIEIPNLGSNRYSATVVPPDGETWIQTSTLEGGHDWDVWLYEGYLGNDPEVILSGSQVPVAQFGFVRPCTFGDLTDSCGTNDLPGTGHIMGRVISTKSYLPPAGGDTNEGGVSRPWIAVSDLRQTDDLLVYAGQGDVNGDFDISGVPDSTYQVTMWDGPQNLLLALTTVIVEGGAVVDIGEFALPHWFSEVHGTVFVDDDGDGAEEDTDGNGKQDAGESGLAGFVLVLKQRDNAVVDAGSKFATTDFMGRYSFPQVYPYAWWNILEAYSDLFYTTGVTFRSDNMFEADGVTPRYNTRLGAGVDVSTLNQDGLNSEINWGVRPYANGTNGGIVGSVTLAVTRNELDPRLAATEDYEPGIPGVTVNLWAPVPCTDPLDPDQNCDAAGDYQRDPVSGAYKKGAQLNDYLSEEFVRPSGCQALNAAGEPMPLPFMSPVDFEHECIESPLMGNQMKTGPTESDPWDVSEPSGESEFSLVNGNYGFGDGCLNSTFVPGAGPGEGHCEDVLGDPVDPEPLVAGQDYLVEVVVPDDAWGKPKYQVLREEDVNVFDGDDFEPAIPPPPCAGALHVVDVLGSGADGADAVYNPGFADGGGSPFEGQVRPLCDMKLVPVANRKSIAPSFFFFADVPAPGRLYGAVVEDLALGTDPSEFYYGEKAGLPNSPIGVYDYDNDLVLNTQSDPHGFFEMLLPSTRTFNCPLPAGPCPNVYKVVGNDPGQPGHPNSNYDPQYRTLESDWQLWPGLTLLADVAILPAASVIEMPGTQNTHPPDCNVEPDRPQLFAVNTPVFVSGTGGELVIEGQHFGDVPGGVTLGGTVLSVIPADWSDGVITTDVPAGLATGEYQLSVTSPSGLPTVNGLTIHVRAAMSEVYEVGVGMTYDPTVDEHAIQSALDDAAVAYVADNTTEALVVVHPDAPGLFTPLGDHYENVIVHTPLKLQGIGPGGVREDGTFVPGSILNALGFATQRADAWEAEIYGIWSAFGWDGPTDTLSGLPLISDGELVFVVARDGEFDSSYRAAIDGFTLKSGDAFPLAAGTEGSTVLPNFPTQGGAIFVNAYARHLLITNNVIAGSGGAYAGAIRVGTPNVGDTHNDDLRIANNRIVANGGSNLAGAIGLFNGTNGYEIDHNDVCGNFSAEYGGGISHYGLSSATGPAAQIHHNRVWFNRSYDEGGGIFIAGEAQPAAAPTLSPGSGPVEIYGNVLQGNFADDDGGGLRFLMAGDHQIDVYNNNIVNNVSTHEGGGVAFDDATNVRFFNNTVMKNLTTATAATSDGDPAPAGLSDSGNTALLQATLPPGHAEYSDPLLFNNIFWDNRAGKLEVSIDGDYAISGLDLPGDSGPIRHWDMGVIGALGPLHPTDSILTEATGSAPADCDTISAGEFEPCSYIVMDGSNLVSIDPMVIDPYDVSIDFLPWRAGGLFVFVFIVTDDLPPDLLADYHLTTGSPAENEGASSKALTAAPSSDIDGDGRPSDLGYELGADELPGVVSDIAPPLITFAGASPDPADTSITLTVTADDSGTGGSAIAAIEWFDATETDPGPGSATPLPASVGTYGTDSIVTGSDVISTSLWSEGVHTLRVRASDAAAPPNWSGLSDVDVRVDRTGPAFTAGPAVAPNPTDGAIFATLTASVDDSAHGGSTIASAVWWRDCDPTMLPLPAADGAFDEVAEDLTVPVLVLSGACGVPSQTLWVRAVDSAGHSTDASVVMDVPDLIFADDFETGDRSRWSGSFGSLAQLAVLGSAAHDGAYGLQVTLAGGSKAGVTDTSPTAETAYRARFWFDPNGSNPGTKEEGLLVAKSASGKTLFKIQFRLSGGLYQIREVVLIANKEQKSAWTTISDDWHAIEIAWTSGPAGGADLYLDADFDDLIVDVPIASLSGNTSAYTLDTVQLGAAGGMTGSATGTQYFDGFVSTRTTPIGL